ncbi:DUF4810 domain-containing protein [Piscinibacter sp. XHJ-5]|uniref:DUF4810 domain-containing protein n=1 Tax=Piscinibacter sp. XHJ-5 TaxID=3037797 RepID=UPI0024537414|nr:DUF4810 domain-containing protein [Piscinibacter sp. XHJ-5]
MIGTAALRRLAIAGCAMGLAACATKVAPLYQWETFPRQQYDTLLRAGSSPVEQIRLMEAQAEKARGAGAQLPPGFRAHLGMLHLDTGNADQARQLWQAEKVAFPESSPYMDRLLKRLDTPTKNDTAARKGSPA